jgi:hypothetical protein
MRFVLITLVVSAAVAAMCGWPLAWLFATFGGHGYASPLEHDVLFGLGTSVCLGLLVGGMICGVGAVVGAWRSEKTLEKTHPPEKGVRPSN